MPSRNAFSVDGSGVPESGVMNAIRGCASVPSDATSSNTAMTAAFSSGSLDQVGRHELGRDALGFSGVVVELDLDAVRIVEEELEQRLAVCSSLRELDTLATQMQQHIFQSSCTKRDV